MRIIRIMNFISVTLNSGAVISSNECTDDLYNIIVGHQENEELVVGLLLPKKVEKLEEIKEAQIEIAKYEESAYLEIRGDSVCLPCVSDITLPESLAKAILKAEQEENTELIETYINFWTLCSTNPDSRARTNLFWFLQKYGMTISKSGLFVAYRNVNVKKEGSTYNNIETAFITEQYTKIKTVWKKSPKNYVLDWNEDDILTVQPALEVDIRTTLQEAYEKLSEKNVATTYTDAKTGKMNINIGKIVSIPREECDPNQDNTCSSGLHVASKGWLQSNYFGKVQLMCLVNPSQVVATPPQDGYGKMRVCAYYPVKAFSEGSEDVEETLLDGFEDDFFSQISYDGDINSEESFEHTIKIPMIPEVNKDRLLKNISNIQESIKSRMV